MERPQSEPKLPDMIMCGDHPSFGKMELNLTDKPDDKEKEKITCYTTKVSPSTSRTMGELIQTSASEAAMRLMEARRRVRSLEIVARSDGDALAPENKALVQGMGSHCQVLVEVALNALNYRGRGHVKRTKRNEVVPMNNLLIQAALGSFRWPPYLLCVWVAVLVLTHLLHCLVTLLERTLPNLRKFCNYFKQWTEEAWKAEEDQTKFVPVSLALMTVILYTAYFVFYALYTVAYWSIEPLCSDSEISKSCENIPDKMSIGCDAPLAKPNRRSVC